MSMVDYVEGYQPGFLGAIAGMHGVYYAKVWGSGEGFEGLMACELHDFLQNYNPERDLLLTAHADGKLIGSIAVDGREGARLRWVLLDEAYHGQGIGKELLKRSLAFTKSAGFATIYLWTVEGLPESMGLYLKAGFKVVEQVDGDHYTIEQHNLRLEMTL